MIIKFIIINFFIKIIPLFIVWKDKIVKKDIYATILLFLFYLFWILINGGFSFVFEIYHDLLYGYSNDKSKYKSKKETYFSYLYDTLYNKLYNQFYKN